MGDPLAQLVRAFAAPRKSEPQIFFFFGLFAREFVPDFALIGPSHPVHLEISLLINLPYCRLSATPA